MVVISKIFDSIDTERMRRVGGRLMHMQNIPENLERVLQPPPGATHLLNGVCDAKASN